MTRLAPFSMSAMAWLRKPSSFRAHETGFPFKAGYFRFARHLGGTGVGFWLVPMARGFVALRDEKTRENSNFRNTEMANIKTEGVSART